MLRTPLQGWLPVSELMAGLPSKLMGLLIPLFFAVCVVRESFIQLTTLWTWHLALATTFAQVHHLLSLRLSLTFIPASIALGVTFARFATPFAVAPFVDWVEHVETQEFGLFNASLPVFAVDLSFVVVIVDMAFACIFCFLPFSLGRIILWSGSCLDFGNVDEISYYTSTASTLLIGYGLIFKVAATSAGVHIFYLYLRGKRLVVAMFFRSLCRIFLRGVINSTYVANVSLNILFDAIIYPLSFGWSLDICTSKMFGATMPQRFKFLIASSFACAALHWHIGCAFLDLCPILYQFLHKILRPGITTPFIYCALSEPFYKYYLKKLLGLLVDTIFIALVILVPIKIAELLALGIFPLDITYFDHPAKDTSAWQGPLNFAESLSGSVHMMYLIGKTLVHLGRLVERVIGYWFDTTGQALGNNVAPRDQYGSSDDAKDEWKFAAVQTMLRAVVAWLTAVIFNSAMLLFPVSVGHVLLFAIPQLPVAGGLKSNDLFAIAAGLCVISTIYAACRDLSACMTSGGTSLLALKRHLVFFIWMVIIPLLIGLLIDLSLISPFAGSDDDCPVLNFFCTWLLGRLFKHIWIKCFVDENLEAKLNREKEDLSPERRPMWWFFQDVCVPVAAKLLAALGVPYLLAKGIFPRLGFSANVNLIVYHYAWSGSLGLCAFRCLSKALRIKMHERQNA